MDSSTRIDNFQRSANLDEKQRQFLSQFVIDPVVQQLIPSSIVGDSVNISAATVGLLLTHQPLVTRFYHFNPYQDSDYDRLSQLLSGRRGKFVRILASGYDYDLTHTLYYVPEGSMERSISTSELTVSGVELAGAYTFGRENMAVFLEEIVKCCGDFGKVSIKVANIMSPSNIVEWLRLEAPRHDYFEPMGTVVNRSDEKGRIASLRTNYSLHLYSPRDTWIRHLGMDWPDYFFGQE